MYEGMDLGTLWKMKGETNGAVYRVLMQSLDGDDGITVTFDCNDEMVTRTVDWIRENMQPVI